MDAATTDNSSLEGEDGRDECGEEEEARGDHIDCAESGKLIYNVPKKNFQKDINTYFPTSCLYPTTMTVRAVSSNIKIDLILSWSG